MTPVTQRHVLSYLVIMVVVPVLAAFGEQIAQGNVPIPTGWAWVVPLLLVGITGLTTLLPKLVSEMSADLAPTIPPPTPAPVVSPVVSPAVPPAPEPPPPATA